MEQKINSGAIFKNDNKSSDKHPEYKGKINVDGKEYAIALWLNESKAGVRYFSVKLELPYVKNEEVSKAVETLKPLLDDDLPF